MILYSLAVELFKYSFSAPVFFFFSFLSDDKLSTTEKCLRLQEVRQDSRLQTETATRSNNGGT